MAYVSGRWTLLWQIVVSVRHLWHMLVGVGHCCGICQCLSDTAVADISVCQTLLWQILVGAGHCCGRC